MVVKCAWHKQNFGHELVLGEKEPLADKRISHGQCPRCQEKMKEEMVALPLFQKAFNETFPINESAPRHIR